MLDLHIHLWPHGPGTPVPTFEQLERYCEAAVERGISQIAITEHSHRFDRILNEVIPEWDRPTTGAAADATAHVLDLEGGADLDEYVTALTDAQDAGLPLLVGLEVDFLPGAMPAMSSVLNDYPFDVLLGSVHWIDEWLFDDYGNPAFAARWAESDIDDVFSRYVDSVLELADSGTVDVLAHLDVIKVAGHAAPRLAEHEDRLAAGLVDTDVAIEYSTAGLRKPAADTYPSTRLLDALLAQGKTLTTASDAHLCEQIGHRFDHLSDSLDQRNITELATFNKRTRLIAQR